MNHPSIDQMNREVAEKLGLCWHEIRSIRAKDFIGAVKYRQCSCEEKFYDKADEDNHIKQHNPDFTTDAGKALLMSKVRLLPNFQDFYKRIIGSYYNREFHAWMHNGEYIYDTPSEHKLLTAAWEWLCGKEKV